VKRIKPINARNAEFWAALEDPREEPTANEGVLALVREAHQLEFRAIYELHDRQRAKQTAAAGAERRDKGDATRFAVLQSAEQFIAKRGRMFRSDLSRLIATDVGISAEHALRILKQQAHKNKRGRSTICSSLPASTI
jgi:hypothetical protein